MRTLIFDLYEFIVKNRYRIINIFLFLILAAFFINYTQRLKTIDVLSVNLNSINHNTDKIFNLILEQNKKDSIRDIKLNHFPTSSPIDPAAMSKVTSEYGYRQDPGTGAKIFHTAIDFSAKKGTAVLATAEGIVEKAEMNEGYGKMILIDHGNGYKTLYAHLSSIDVLKGYKIQKGDTIGTVGSSGYSTGNHLHYEVTYLNKKVNPSIFTSL